MDHVRGAPVGVVVVHFRDNAHSEVLEMGRNVLGCCSAAQETCQRPEIRVVFIVWQQADEPDGCPFVV